MNKPKCDKTYIRLTYRDNIKALIPETYYKRDSGWGCMIRAGQMLVANVLYLKLHKPFKDVILLFDDNSLNPFSIQILTRISKIELPDHPQYGWYSPSYISWVLKVAVQTYDSKFKVKIFNDSSIFHDEIPKEGEHLLIIVMARLGVKEPEERLLQFFKKLASSQYYVGVLGGVPNRAYFMTRVENDYIGYLDPHQTQVAPSSTEEIEKQLPNYQARLEWLALTKVDPSMGICFYMENSQINQFWEEMQQIRHENESNCFIYFEKTRPEINDGDVIACGQDFFVQAPPK